MPTPSLSALLVWLHRLAAALRRLAGARLGLGIAVVAIAALPACKSNKGAPATKSPGGEHLGTSADVGGPPPSYAHGGGATPGDYGESDDSYEPSPSSAPKSERERAYDEDGARIAEKRPGLGTEYGEQHHSRVVTSPFHRASGSPDVVLSLWYNDWEGVGMAERAYGHRGGTSSQVATPDGVFVVSLVDDNGFALPATDIDGRRYAVGSVGQRYRIRIQNNSAYRFEVVASVDGLDVIDGREAAFHKRGYIVGPWGSITVDGWRTSEEAVAAFRFSDIEESYAERTGSGRNVGVVGVAFFHERGSVPWSEIDRRHSAEPFPGRFAAPPPR